MAMDNIVVDPIEFARVHWPDIRFYKQQQDIIYSVVENDETVVPAGNELGKDFVAAFIILWFFCSRLPARIVATGPSERQVEDVLWGEIKRFVDTSKYKLPVVYSHMLLRRTRRDGSIVPACEVRGQVAQKGESLLGRHTPRGLGGLPMTMAVFDEGSGIDDMPYQSSDTWAHRKLIIGNPRPCTNFFFHAVQSGDKRSPANNHYWRKVIRIRADDSPNVRAGRAGLQKILVPGLVTWEDYQKRRAQWGREQQAWGLDAEFYEGPELKLFPAEWLNRAEAAADGGVKPKGRITIGSDPAEGGDSTVWAVVCENGLLELVSMKTPNTAVISNWTLGLMRKWHVQPEDVYLDQGGGGKEHADYLREKGYPVQTVAFGKPVNADGGMVTFWEKRDMREQGYGYKNRRAQMYDLISQRLNPDNGSPFAIGREHAELRRQLSPIPRLYDGEGRMYLPPKRKVPHSNVQTMIDLCGHSPDEADALALAVYGLSQERFEIGPI